MPSSVARLLDANANRAREALRVMEDYTRFILDDSDLARELKEMRHELRAALGALPSGMIEANRDTPSDVGVSISTESENMRATVADVVIAAGKRLTEALRTLEEYGKTIDGPFAKAVEALRYRAYELESHLQLRLASGRARQWRVCVLLTEAMCKRPWLDTLDAVIEGGADCVQMREKDLPDGKLLGRAHAIVRRCHAAGVSVIVNNRPDIAMMAGADGVHLGQTDVPITHVRRLVGRRLLIGVSTANVIQAEGAWRNGADYCGVGPMFPTTTKDKPELAGPAYLREYVERIPLPHLAIGGITPANVDALLEVGVRGVAVSSAVCASDDPVGATRALRAAIDRA